MFKKAFDFVDTIVVTMNKTIAVGGMILAILLTFVNVILRYTFNDGLSWSYEMTNCLFIWSALFGAAYGFKKGIHISVTMLLHLFPIKVAKFFVIFASAFSCLFLLFIVYCAVLSLEGAFILQEVVPDLWNVPKWIPMLVIPISFAAASFRAGEKVYEFAKTPANEILKTSEEELVHDSAVKE
ncbi:MAG: TRAP transporter small permease [Campylobacteraceae bacterium]|jgi:C4-dicarboxylate transporter DctQ subunit|nr:TRAP transporter small permease [Campylobacteraceae bacterium]